MSAYATEAEAGDYCDARALSPEPTDEALLRASEYIDARFRARFPGRKLGGRAQVREWPRSGAFDADGDPIIGVPDEIKAATIEAAIREEREPGSLSPDVVPGKIVRSASVDGAVSVTYADATASGMVPMLSAVEGLLSAILISARAGAGVMLVR